MHGGHPENPAPVSPVDLSALWYDPSAMPYLLNPAGITLLVILSGAIDSWLVVGILVFPVLLMEAFDGRIFRNLYSIAKQLDKLRLAVTGAVIGVLLAARAVQLVLRRLADLGVIELVGHHEWVLGRDSKRTETWLSGPTCSTRMNHRMCALHSH